ncbi:uncharacterized protein MONOS_18154 [Monocercomonoides exilis]|uniref:uncharacterized protein n=1 Tax=Monocercomonoides exilis TaxID=2049356 RepID=UPI003559A2EC|nr:hypothetical protein MONOS_18154 [Monocercomonoides exilis]
MSTLSIVREKLNGSGSVIYEDPREIIDCTANQSVNTKSKIKTSYQKSCSCDETFYLEQRIPHSETKREFLNAETTAENEIKVISPLAKSLLSDENLWRGTLFIVKQMQTLLPELFEPDLSVSSIQYLTPADIAAHSKSVACKLCKKVKHFFQVIRSTCSLITAEMIHVLFLLDELIGCEKIAKADGWTAIVSENNLGTLLLVAVILSLKFNRDSAHSNKWWSQTLGIEANVITLSESVFLQRIEHKMMMDEETFIQYWKLFEAQPIV